MSYLCPKTLEKAKSAISQFGFFACLTLLKSLGFSIFFHETFTLTLAIQFLIVNMHQIQHCGWKSFDNYALQTLFGPNKCLPIWYAFRKWTLTIVRPWSDTQCASKNSWVSIGSITLKAWKQVSSSITKDLTHIPVRFVSASKPGSRKLGNLKDLRMENSFSIIV